MLYGVPYYADAVMVYDTCADCAYSATSYTGCGNATRSTPARGDVATPLACQDACRSEFRSVLVEWTQEGTCGCYEDCEVPESGGSQRA